LIAAVYNAIVSNVAVRNSTILVIVYSNHGGLYDHVPPPVTVNPDGNVSTEPAFDFKRLGVRVPAVVISPYIEPGTVDHTVYDHTSLIATARKLFLGAAWADTWLTERDRRANTFDHLLTRSSPRTDYVTFQ
jgi:phospholipase C